MYVNDFPLKSGVTRIKCQTLICEYHFILYLSCVFACDSPTMKMLQWISGIILLAFLILEDHPCQCAVVRITMQSFPEILSWFHCVLTGITLQTIVLKEPHGTLKTNEFVVAWAFMRKSTVDASDINGLCLTVYGSVNLLQLWEWGINWTNK